MELPIEPATLADAEGILKLQFLCFQREAARYDDYSLPPLTQTLAELKAEIADSVALVCRSGAEVVGSVRAQMRNGRCLIARLIVHPRFQGKGLGTRLMGEIESRFPAGTDFELFTGHLSESTLRLYQRIGYKPFKIEQAGRVKLVFLEKKSSGRPYAGSRGEIGSEDDRPFNTSS